MNGSRVVNLEHYRGDGKITICRSRNSKRIENTYYPQARSEYRLNAVLQEGSASIGICGQAVDVSVYFFKPVHLRNYHPPYWERGWRYEGGSVVWEDGQ